MFGQLFDQYCWPIQILASYLTSIAGQTQILARVFDHFAGQT